MQNPNAIIAAVSFTALLAACSSGGGGTPSFETPTSSVETTGTLVGSAIRSGPGGQLDVTTVEGEISQTTGATTISDGTYTLIDSNGASAEGVLDDGSSTLVPNNGFTGTYEHVLLYNQSYEISGETYDTFGVYGFATDASDMPGRDSATYTGEANGLVIAADGGFDLTDGTSTVIADFGSGTVDVTLTDFTAIDQGTGAAASAPIDTIEAIGMSINGNGFSGGTLTTYKDDIATSVIGVPGPEDAQGHFFGYDSSIAAPDEVGGNILLQGDGGLVSGTFIAD